MNIMICPHVNVLSPEVDDLVRIYEIPNNVITQKLLKPQIDR